MIITIASGKGGTGKTLLATGLARVAGMEQPGAVHLLDCDVEEPNAHLFLKPLFTCSEVVTVPVPAIDPSRCTLCGHCAEVCAFHALAVVRDKVLVFPQLCHGCGSCTLQCPEQAIAEEPMRLGHIEWGRAREVHMAQGVLDIGQALAVPVIRRLKQRTMPAQAEQSLVLLDAPPGNACPAVEALRGSDLALLVTEPTPFGLHDLEIAVEITRQLGLPAVVVINRDGLGDRGVDDYCARAGLPILLRIPLDRRIAEAYADGQLWVDVLPEYREAVQALCNELRARIGGRP